MKRQSSPGLFISVCTDFHPETLPWRLFCPIYFILMNSDLNCGQLDMQSFRSCSGFVYDLLDESSMHFWSNFHDRAFWKIHWCFTFSPFGSLWLIFMNQSLRNIFATLSRLINVDDWYFMLSDRFSLSELNWSFPKTCVYSVNPCHINY